MVTPKERGRTTDDTRLRRYGWVVVSRPDTGAVLWKRNGIVRPEAEALRLCDLELMRVERSAARGRPV